MHFRNTDQLHPDIHGINRTILCLEILLGLICFPSRISSMNLHILQLKLDQTPDVLTLLICFLSWFLIFIFKCIIYL